MFNVESHINKQYSWDKNKWIQIILISRNSGLLFKCRFDAFCIFSNELDHSEIQYFGIKITLIEYIAEPYLCALPPLLNASRHRSLLCTVMSCCLSKQGAKYMRSAAANSVRTTAHICTALFFSELVALGICRQLNTSDNLQQTGRSLLIYWSSHNNLFLKFYSLQ